MAAKFKKLTRTNMRALPIGKAITEQGITFRKGVKGGTFTISVMINSNRIKRTVGKDSDDITPARCLEVIEDLKAQSRAGTLNITKQKNRPKSVNAAAKRYLGYLEQTGGSDIPYKKRMFRLHILPALGHYALDGLTSEALLCYVKGRRDAGYKPASIKRELATISHLYNTALKLHWLVFKPFTLPTVRVENERFTYLTPTQAVQLKEAAKHDVNPHIHAYMIVSLGSGMRKSEVLKIKIQDIDLTKAIIHVPTAKAGSRNQPITAETVEFLRHYIPATHTGSPWLFPNPKSKEGRLMDVKKAFRRCVVRAGLQEGMFTPHTTRHTVISNGAMADIPFAILKEISGHKTDKMLARYTHVDNQHVRSAMQQIQEFSTAI